MTVGEMLRTIIVAGLSAGFFAASAAGAMAEDLFFFEPVTINSPILTELRVGVTFAGVELNEDVLILPASIDPGKVQNLTLEAIYGGIDLDVFNVPGDIRPVLGASLSLNDADSWAWAGINYHVTLLDPVFFEFTLGGVVHNGYLENPPEGRDAYGCRALLYASGGFGVNINEFSTATVTLDHGSHARACGSTNPGFNAISLKYGYKF
jgi:hypothetical protein